MYGEVVLKYLEMKNKKDEEEDAEKELPKEPMGIAGAIKRTYNKVK
jgi:hypothetical protein